MEEKIRMLVFHLIVKRGAIDRKVRRTFRLEMLLKDFLPNVFVCHKDFG